MTTESEKAVEAAGAAPGAPSAAPPPVPAGVVKWQTRPRFWGDWGGALFGIGVVALGVIAFLSSVSGRSTQPPSSNAWTRNPDAVWTEAESERLGTIEFFRKADLGAGPPPFAFTPQGGPASVPVREDNRPGEVRQAYDAALVSLGPPWRTRLQDEAGPESVRNATVEVAAALNSLRRANQQAGERTGRTRESAARFYHLALAVSWRGSSADALGYLESARMGDAPMCPDALPDENADGPSGDEVTHRRGAQIACLWLRGRLRLQGGQAQPAADDLERALILTQRAQADYATQRVGSENIGAAIITFVPEVHLISGTSAGLWRDYLAALLASPTLPKPKSPVGDDVAVSLAAPPSLEMLRQDDDRAFREYPDLAALARTVALRRGEVSLARAIPADGAVNLSARNLNAAVEIIADAGQNFGQLDADVAAELRDWQIHRCHRERVLDGHSGWAGCPGKLTTKFATWERGDWTRQIRQNRRSLNGGGVQLGPWLFGLGAVLSAIAGLALWFHGRAATAFRVRRYNEVMGSRHRANALEKRRIRYTPPPPPPPAPPPPPPPPPRPRATPPASTKPPSKRAPAKPAAKGRKRK